MNLISHMYSLALCTASVQSRTFLPFLPHGNIGKLPNGSLCFPFILPSDAIMIFLKWLHTHLHTHTHKSREFHGSPTVKILCFHCWGETKINLTLQLKSYKLCGMAEKKNLGFAFSYRLSHCSVHSIILTLISLYSNKLRAICVFSTRLSVSWRQLLVLMNCLIPCLMW